MLGGCAGGCGLPTITKAKMKIVAGKFFIGCFNI
jgi:hypothetical protein